jgi:hypothetical protein
LFKAHHYQHNLVYKLASKQLSDTQVVIEMKHQTLIPLHFHKRDQGSLVENNVYTFPTTLD